MFCGNCKWQILFNHNRPQLSNKQNKKSQNYRCILLFKLNSIMQGELQQIMEMCEIINEWLEINNSEFTLQELKAKDWYLSILYTIFPPLQDKLKQIAEIKGSAEAIDSMLLLLSEQNIIEEDFLQIKGVNLAEGDLESIYYVVQLFHALVSRAIQEEQQEEIKPKEKAASASKKKQRPKSETENKESHFSAFGADHHFEETQSNQISHAQKPKGVDQEEDSYTNENYHADFKHLARPESALKKYQSETKFQNSTKHKNTYQSKSPGLMMTTQKKKLVKHPKKVPHYRKAANPQAKELTKKVKSNIKEIYNNRPAENLHQNYRYRSPQTKQLQKKRNKLQYKIRQAEKQKDLIRKQKQAQVLYRSKSNEQLKKLLNWKEAKLKKDRDNFEQGLKIRLRDKQQIYVKHVNNLLIKLEKEKAIQQKKDYKAKITSENKKALQKMMALEQYYHDQLNLVKQNKINKREQHKLMHTGHKQIMRMLQKKLKQDNETQMMHLAMKYRNEQHNIATDLQQLQRRIIQTYKKY